MLYSNLIAHPLQIQDIYCFILFDLSSSSEGVNYSVEVLHAHFVKLLLPYDFKIAYDEGPQ